MKLCECGCGQFVTNDTNRFILGHNTRWEYDNDPVLTKRRKDAAKATFKTKEFSNKVSIGTKKALQKPETIQKNKDRMYRRYSNPLERKRHSEVLKVVCNTPEQRALRRQIQRKRFKDPNEIEKNRRAAEINWSTPGKRELMSIKMKALWNDPEYRELVISKQQEWWDDVDNRESRSGSNASNWQGGIMYEPYCAEFYVEDYREWLRERDNHTCQNPYCRKNCDDRIHLHHIDHDKKNCHPDNFIVVCVSCNGRANFHIPYWERLYKRIRKLKFNPRLMFE